MENTANGRSYGTEPVMRDWEDLEGRRIPFQADEKKKAGGKGIWLILLGAVLLVLAMIGVVNAAMLSEQLKEMGMGHLSIDEAMNVLNELAAFTGQSATEALNGADGFVLFTVARRGLMAILGCMSLVGGFLIRKTAK